MKKISLYIIATSLFLIIYVLFSSLKIDKVYDTKNLVGKPIPELDLKLLNETKTFNTKEINKNNFTLINFFSSWCAPCRQEHKYLIELKKNNNLKIIGINFKDEKAKANEFLKKLGNPYHLILSDNTGKESVNFGVYGIPETILVDKNLITLKKYIGPLNNLDVKEILKLTKEQ